MKKRKDQILFSPGPANISERVRMALLRPDICHRDQEFTDLLRDTERLLLQLTGAAGYRPAILTGSGTAAIEAAIVCLKAMKKRILVVSNGIYGDRAFDIAKIYHISARKICFPDNQLPDISRIDHAINQFKPDVLYVVHHETTTGLLNPLPEISQLSKKYGLLFVVDAVSSIAGDVFRPKKWGVDLVIGSANKCIRGTPGLSFVLVSPVCAAKMKNSFKKNHYYLDLVSHLEIESKGQTPFTPAVHNFFAFQEALSELDEEGVKNRIKHYQDISAALRSGLVEMGLTLYVPREISSNTMTTVLLPDGVTYQWLHQQCKENGFCIYASMGKLKNKSFRLGVVGRITEQDIKRFLKVLGTILKKTGHMRKA